MTRGRHVIPILMIALLAWASARAQVRDLSVERTQGRRLALVVGNNEYAYAPSLNNAVNDAQDLSDALSRLGFTVTTVRNSDLRTFSEAVDRFIAALQPGDVAFFHYSGHGMEIDGENYLIPTDFALKDPASVPYDAYSASKLHDRMAGASSRLNIIVLDACRNNGFQATRSGRGGGLASMNAAAGSFIAFATAPGQTADDGVDGRNGLFTAHLLNAIETPGLTIDEVFNRVRLGVYEESSNRQLPWTSSSVIGDFFFRWRLPEPPTSPEPEEDNILGPKAVEMELAYWESIKSGTNPAMFEAYLRKYPDGHFADLARIRLEELGGGAAAETPEPEQLTEAAPPVVQPEVEPERQPATQPTAQPADEQPAIERPATEQPPDVSVERLPVVAGPAGIQTRVARTVPELHALANARQDRRFTVFQLEESDRFKAFGRHGAELMLKKADPKRGRYTLVLREGAGQAMRPGPGPSTAAPTLRPDAEVSDLNKLVGRELELKNESPGAVLQFHVDGERCDELVILEVGEGAVAGYLAEAVR